MHIKLCRKYELLLCTRVYYTVLIRVTLYYIVWHLYNAVWYLYSIIPHSKALHYIVLHCTMLAFVQCCMNAALYYIVKHCITKFHCIVLYGMSKVYISIALCYIVLQYNTLLLCTALIPMLWKFVVYNCIYV